MKKVIQTAVGLAIVGVGVAGWALAIKASNDAWHECRLNHSTKECVAWFDGGDGAG
jgi:hypothetical protein